MRVHCSVSPARSRLVARAGRWAPPAHGDDRVLLASMGAVSAGLAVSTTWDLYSARQPSDLDACCFNPSGREEDSWEGHLRASLRSLRRQLERKASPLQDDNAKVLAAIIAANVAVWGMWRVSFRYPRMERFMWRHFACSYDGVVRGKRVHTLLTSAFSHITIPHIAINMFMLWEFGLPIMAPRDARDSWFDCALSRSRVLSAWRSLKAEIHGRDLLDLDRFFTLYVSSALASSTLSIAASRLRGFPATFTLGASGAVMGVLTTCCLLYPDRRLMLYGFIEMTSAEMLQAVTAFNLIGAAFQRSLQIDCTGHLGGQAAAMALRQLPPSSRGNDS
ncbi:hypothetical protein P43SY_001013 [Pythium insidiosum]|uniref:Peptidase S54 rhomboid domain-containing protein n=1 Tax=Pythium insidiosum TaxID=114742 RepID=A0AAD5QAT8_PYTIN|nr:hypothetical protein P43SY_001013 [Pythium insidiosum]